MQSEIGSSNIACALCSLTIKSKGYTDADNHFCCAGCQAVYQILLCQKALPHFQEHPLFKQAIKIGLISNPDLLEQARLQQMDLEQGELEKLHLEIQDMWCPSCTQVIHLSLMQEKGIFRCVVDYSTDLASIEYSLRYLSKDKIIKIISLLGYRPLPLQNLAQKAVSRSLYTRFIVAAFCALNMMMFAYPIYVSYFDLAALEYAKLFAWLSFVASIPVLFYSGWPIWRRFYTGLKVGLWGMEALIFIGVSTAFGLSLYELVQGRAIVYFDSMSVIIAFVLLGKIIESKAKFSAKDSLFRLTLGLPRRGRKRMENGEEEFVPLKDVIPGDYVVALSGEKVVLDGLVVEGEGACDESLMTGESLPQIKRIGNRALAGSLLQQGRLVIQVSAKLEETALQRIIQMIEQDIGHKTQYVRLADQIAKWFVPLVLVLSVLTGVYCYYMLILDPPYTHLQTALIRAISVLLISCPCAIGIAAPLAESQILNALAKLGIIVRNRGCLAFLGRESIFIFDKTGTVTEGTFKVLQGLKGLNQQELMLLKGLVACSNHPIAVALNHSLSCLATKFDHVEEVIGKGIRGWIATDIYYVGSAQFLQEQQVKLSSKSSAEELSEIQTQIFFAKNQTCLATIILGDRIRPDAKQLIQSLQPIKSLLVSGDAVEAVKAVAQACQFHGWHAGFHPLQKRELIDQLRKKGEIVAMLGDGLNDAPALTAAHLGMAVLSATDASIQVSDLLLTTDRLQVIAQARQVANKGRHIVKQNLFWAFAYNVIGIALAMGGLLSPIFAVFAMMLSSLIVLFNAYRVRY